MVDQVSESAWAPGVPVKPTSVLVLQEAKPGVNPEQVARIMPEEARKTVLHYANGTILNMHSRADSRGAVFVLNCDTPEKAKEIMDDMPLAKAGLMNYTFIPMAPLGQLNTLQRPSLSRPGFSR